MEHDAWFFVGIFVFIFVIWMAIGGPTRPLSFTGPTLAQPGALGGGTYLQLPQVPFVVGNASGPLSVETRGNNSGSGQSAKMPPFVGGSEFGPLSPYRNIIRFNHSVSGAGSPDPTNEYLEISVPQNAAAPIDLSGWKLVSDATGNTVTISKGTGVPISGTINDAEDIALAPGERALIISGRSPIGSSFRENKCIGYFSSFQTFYPSLPQNCPVPSDELISFYGTGYIRDGSCIDYANTLSRCQVMLSPPVNLSNACQNFMVKYLNYNGCVQAHRGDTDFDGTTWRIYLGRTAPMWRTRHEIVKLIDTNGKTVDAFSY